MNHLFLSDDEIKNDLYPFTSIRSAADIRVGILTIREKWQAYLPNIKIVQKNDNDLPADTIVIAANIIPDESVAASALGNNKPSVGGAKTIHHPWQIFMFNDLALRQDFKLITSLKKSAPIPPGVATTTPEQIFIEEGAKLTHCIINAETGPVYIGKNAQIMEGAILRGPIAICEGAIVKMGAKIYGATTIGPYSIAGGEIKNSVIFGFSNKAHDGYLGDSVVGEWCNLGAGTSNSNVKNNASDVKIYSSYQKKYISTGSNKCGLIMGDFSRCSINTSFNTGTMVGICANIFGAGLTPKYIPDFSWGLEGNTKYEFDKAAEDIDKWMKLKGHSLTEIERKRLRLIFDEI